MCGNPEMHLMVYHILLGTNRSSVSTFRLHRDCMMQLVMEEVLARKPLFPSIFGMGAWWREYNVTEHEGQRFATTPYEGVMPINHDCKLSIARD